MNAVIRGTTGGRAEAGRQTDGEADAQQAADAPPSFDGGARTTALTPLTPQLWLQGVLHERLYGVGSRPRPASLRRNRD